MFTLSTGLRQNLLDGTGLRSTFAKGIIEIRTGPQPVNADAAVQGTLLGTVTVNAGAFTPGSPTNGLSFDAPVAGVVSKAAAEAWQMVGIAAGTAGWFRFKQNGTDAGGSSTTLQRMDGSVATSGGDLNLSNIAITVGTPVTIDVFTITDPAS